VDRSASPLTNPRQPYLAVIPAIAFMIAAYMGARLIEMIVTANAKDFREKSPFGAGAVTTSAFAALLVVAWMALVVYVSSQAVSGALLMDFPSILRNDRLMRGEPVGY
jgi:hypothetical protein